MEEFKVFIGFDPRQPVAYNVLQHSISTRASKPVSITRLQLDQLPITRQGLTQFTYSRFLVPHLCGYKGHAIFMDADMLVIDDIIQLFDLFDPQYDIQVVKNKEKFEWPSMMMFNCKNCWKLTPSMVETAEDIFRLEQWANVGDLPADWNYCVGYDDFNPNVKLIHYTQGIPVWPETRDCEYADLWHAERMAMMGTVSFAELMGNSVHVARMHNG